MNGNYEPWRHAANHLANLVHGKHASGFVRVSFGPHYVGRHRRDEQAEALSDFFNNRGDVRDAASAVLTGGE